MAPLVVVCAAAATATARHESTAAARGHLEGRPCRHSEGAASTREIDVIDVEADLVERDRVRRPVRDALYADLSSIVVGVRTARTAGARQATAATPRTTSVAEASTAQSSGATS